MLIVLDRHSGQPVFRQIVEQVRFQVASGLLKPGDELPSTRQLAADLALNPMTVSRAYGLLESEGVVERRPGLSLVVKKRRADDERAQRKQELTRIVKRAAAAARQLGLDVDEALDVFKKALEERGGKHGKQ